MIGSMSAHWPYKWTGMIALVRGRDLGFDLGGVDIVRLRVDIDEDRRGTRAAIAPAVAKNV